MKTAKLIKDVSENFNGKACLYELSVPIAEYSWDEDEKPNTHKFVICSTAHAIYSGPETYIFPANENGEVVDWGELEGSMRGNYSHEECLESAGYKLIQ